MQFASRLPSNLKKQYVPCCHKKTMYTRERERERERERDHAVKRRESKIQKMFCMVKIGEKSCGE